MANRVTIPVTNFEALAPPWSLISLDSDLTTVQTGFNDSSLGWVNGIPTDTGVVNAYVVLLPFGAPVSYKQGMTVVFIPANTNTSSSTINVNGLGLIALVNASGSPLVSGQLLANNAYVCVYDGASFRVMNISAEAPTYAVDTGTVNNLVATLSSVPAYVTGVEANIQVINSTTGAVVINFNGLGNKAVVNQAGTALSGGELAKGNVYSMIYDGTSFRVLNPLTLTSVTSGSTGITLNCAGYAEVVAAVTYTSGTPTTTLNNMAPGTIVYLNLINATGSTASFPVAATDENGSAITVNFTQPAVGGSTLFSSPINIVGTGGTHYLPCFGVVEGSGTRAIIFST